MQSINSIITTRLARLFTLVVAAVGIGAASWALLNPNLFLVHDTSHGARIFQMAEALKDGHFPVRWSADLNLGYGSPNFNFYAPLPYYVGGILFLMGLNISVVVKILFLISTIMCWGGGYVLGQNLNWLIHSRWSRLGGILIATALTLAPYRAVDLFVRGAIGESWAIAGIVWVMAGVVMVVRHQKWGGVVLAVATSGLLLSHNLSAMIMLVPGLAFAGLGVTLLGKNLGKNRKKIAKNLVAAVILGALISAFYWLPMLGEQQHIRLDHFTADQFDYSNHFVYLRQFLIPLWGYGGSAPWPYNDMSYFLGYGQVLALLLTMGLMGYKIIQKTQKNMMSLVWIGAQILILVALLLLATNKTMIVWSILPQLQLVQFPWRFLTIAIVFLAMIGSLWIGFLENYKLKLVTALLLIGLIIAGNFQYFRPVRYLQAHEDYFSVDRSVIRNRAGDGFTDYLPSDLTMGEPDPNLVVNPDPVAVLNESNFKVLADSQHYKKIEWLGINSPASVTFNLAYFPGWTSTVDGQIITTQMDQHGLIRLDLPQNSRVVELEFRETPIRKIANGLSVAGLAILFLIIRLVAKPTRPRFFRYFSAGRI